MYPQFQRIVQFNHCNCLSFENCLTKPTLDSIQVNGIMANQLKLSAVVVQGLLSFNTKAGQTRRDEKLKITYCRFKVAHKEINRAEDRKSRSVTFDIVKFKYLTILKSSK